MIRFVRLLVADGEVVLALALVLSWVGAQGVAMLGLICALIVLDARGIGAGRMCGGRRTGGGIRRSDEGVPRTDASGHRAGAVGRRAKDGNWNTEDGWRRREERLRRTDDG